MATSCTTENGRPSVAPADVGDARLAAFFKLVRGLDRTRVKKNVQAVLRSGDAEMIVDAFVLWGQTRDVRGGKGERDIAHWWLVELAKEFPQTVEALLPLVGEFGSWKDFLFLMEDDELPEAVTGAAMKLFVKQIRKDMTAPTPSLAGKWAPREKSAHSKVAKQLAKELFPKLAHPNPEYRKAIAELNRRIDTTEVKMCAGEWGAIDPGSVSAVCLLKNRKSFLNEGKGGEARGSEADRAKCADRFRKHAEECRKEAEERRNDAEQAAKVRMHGSVLSPDQMTAQYMKPGNGKGGWYGKGKGGWYGKGKGGGRGRGKGGKGGGGDDEPSKEDPIIEAQWIDMREGVRESATAASDEDGKVSMQKMIPLVDVSGSMAGKPMEAAIALGILISEIGHPATQDRFITFDTNPTWHSLKSADSLHDKVQSAMSAEWGGSTDLSKAMRLILQACVEGDVPPAEVGELCLIVLSDMQFDQATSRDAIWRLRDSVECPAWETQYEELVRLFEWSGRQTKWAIAYPVPKVVFWNLRGDTDDFPVAANTPGVDMISGFSQNLLKLFMDGDINEAANAPESKDTPAKEKRDPMVTMRKALDDARYNSIRRVCAEVGEGAMAGYRDAPIIS